ncbi:hypothetical protein [Kribbella deserti]|uniref:Uncharacterized protein n=1 Tax=Kribbella deserti TaxID=1926257 RepID=A0ABV6QL99_9ACTN
MEYAEFLAAYKQAYGDWSNGGTADLARLRALVPQLVEADRVKAEFQLGQWESELSPEAGDRMQRATEAMARAGDPDGTAAQRIERALTGIREITAIAEESSDPNEQHAILSLNESLAMLAESLEIEAREAEQ